MITEAMRTEALLSFFGWQGGTIHQLAEATGCPVKTLLYHDLFHEGSDVRFGMSGARTCDTDWRVNRLAPQYQGNWDFWAGAILGHWLTQDPA